MRCLVELELVVVVATIDEASVGCNEAYLLQADRSGQDVCGRRRDVVMQYSVYAAATASLEDTSILAFLYISADLTGSDVSEAMRLCKSLSSMRAELNVDW